VSGCRNRCKGCFQPETWDFRYGKEFTFETLAEIRDLLDNDNIDGLSILGGDPFEPENLEMVEIICEFVRHWFGRSKSIWIWTGYEWEDLKELKIMRYIDVLVDGPFMQELKDLRLSYRGSSNQRVIDIQESNKRGCAIRYKGKEDWK
jgi:anaerobic ribonucleoside-triphosphate reductase activating protein